jgi:hypothetical protein
VKLPNLTTLREWAHTLSAVVGILGVIYGLGIEALKTLGWTIPTQYAAQVAGFGALLVLASKGIDSLNNALTNLGSGTAPPPS